MKLFKDALIYDGTGLRVLLRIFIPEIFRFQELHRQQTLEHIIDRVHFYIQN